MITGPGDNSGAGATWVYARSNGVWTEKSKIVVAGAGSVAAISTDNSTALLAGIEAFVFVQPWYVTMTHPGDLTQGQTVPAFTDVPANAGFFVWIQKMQQLGITSGCGSGMYCPDDSVTRGQMAVFVMRGAFNQLLPSDAPMVVWISPANASPGQTVTVQVEAQNTDFRQGITSFDAGAGISLSNIVVTGPTSLTAQFAIQAGASFGPRSILVNTRAAETVLPNGFQVQ